MKLKELWNRFRSKEISLHSDLEVEECVSRLRNYARRDFKWPWTDKGVRLYTTEAVPDGIFNGNTFRVGKTWIISNSIDVRYQVFNGQITKDGNGARITGHFDLTDELKFITFSPLVLVNLLFLWFIIGAGVNIGLGLLLFAFNNLVLYGNVWISLAMSENSRPDILAFLQAAFEAEIVGDMPEL